MTDKLNQADLETHITNGAAHTYPGLCEQFASSEQHKMQIDRTLQKLRRKGLINFTRNGRTVVWSPVPKQD